MPGQSDPSVLIEEAHAQPSRALRRRVAELLAAGELVALPTETVYGLAARADHPEAVARLRAAKGRPTGDPLTWHVANREAVESFEHLVPMARRLVTSYWPGPLTLILAGVPAGLEGVARGGWTGVRLPAHPTTRALIEALDFPIVMTSANPHGAPPLVDAGAVAAAFGEALRLVVDGGPCRLGEASGILRLGPGHFEVLREGLLPLADLRRTAGLRIAFVCTGNTCRSPMAAGLARALLERRLQCPSGPEGLASFGFAVDSMGVHAGPGLPASDHAVAVLADQGIDLSGHRSRPVIPEELAGYDRVYCLTSGHQQALLGRLPPGKGRHIELLDPRGRDVEDPIGGSRGDYAACALAIADAIQVRAADWA